MKWKPETNGAKIGKSSDIPCYFPITWQVIGMLWLFERYVVLL
jgi:hypothetical protein